MESPSGSVVPAHLNEIVLLILPSGDRCAQAWEQVDDCIQNNSLLSIASVRQNHFDILYASAI